MTRRADPAKPAAARAKRLVSVGDFTTSSGSPLPLGLSSRDGTFNFSVFSSSAIALSLVIFAPGAAAPTVEIELDERNRTGDLWHIAVRGLASEFEWGWRSRQRDGTKTSLLVDPYARCLVSRDGERRGVAVERSFDWQGVGAPNIDPSRRVIYEMHVRGFTRHQSSPVSEEQRGTYAGVTEMIPYLADLGVTTLELLPVFEFDERRVNDEVDPELAATLANYWGYQPIGFFSPSGWLAASSEAGAHIDELRVMVRELHRAGIEVVLDVVYNHTAEGDARPGNPLFSFRGLDDATYYMKDDDRYVDFSGCHNTFNANHPVVADLVLESLRFWASEMRVDGFRFDLASVLTRGEDGSALDPAPVIDRISRDPLLKGRLLIAEAWDAAGLYQVGQFHRWGRWSEWNGPFRDDVRRFVRGDDGMVPAIATRLCGSPDLFSASGRPQSSINFVTAHDGFTLRDLVSYSVKHNEANGEGGRDGAGENFSANWGVEGDSDDPGINGIRRRQQRNMLTILLLSQGIPMLLGGDEIGRTQQGNNNAYCQDNEISWTDWRLLEENRDLFRFVRQLIAIRQRCPLLRQERFLDHTTVSWHGVSAGAPDWQPHSRTLAMQLHGDSHDLYLAMNMWRERLEFALPTLRSGASWRLLIDTAEESPREIFTWDEAPVAGDRIALAPYSCVLLRS